MPKPIRIGTLGAAKITPPALLEPAAGMGDVEIVAIAARDLTRAEQFAEEHEIPTVYSDYQQLLDADDIDAIYNPLPPAMHCEWTIKALRAGKHVLCEKPVASNADEAAQMAQVAKETGLVFMEAFHYRYHPLFARVKSIADDGSLGRIEHAEARFSVPFHTTEDIRFSYALSGGATMDLGCYPIHMLRSALSSEPEVLQAEARADGPPNIDVAMRAELRFRDNIPGKISCSMEADAPLTMSMEIRGTQGSLTVLNPLAPQLGHQLTLALNGTTTTETVDGETTYWHQLRAFVAAVQDDEPILTDGDTAIANMRVIDEIYRQAGLPVRGT